MKNVNGIDRASARLQTRREAPPNEEWRTGFGSIWRMALLVLPLVSCQAIQPYDTGQHLRSEIERRVSPERMASVRIPYELDESVREELGPFLSASGSESRRTEGILDFIFGGLDLEYTLTPTRDAIGTLRAREGNCLSFVNLFVGVGRERHLNPFYVEVRDYQRWNYQQGVVVSRGHIVAGMFVDGSLATFDFLPYQPKAYRDFKPIKDIQAMAHFYNNLGAEALMAGDLDAAGEHLQLAVELAPDFDKAINNLGIYYLRLGEPDEAIARFERGLELIPDNVPLMTNLARTHQQLGNQQEAEALMARLESHDEASPFFYVYRGDQALSNGDKVAALEYMRQAFRADSDLPEVHLGLVRVYLALGELDKARHHVERALKLDATHEEARKYAAMLDRG